MNEITAFHLTIKDVKWLYVEADRDREVILCWYHIMGYGSC